MGIYTFNIQYKALLININGSTKRTGSIKDGIHQQNQRTGNRSRWNRGTGKQLATWGTGITNVGQ